MQLNPPSYFFSHVTEKEQEMEKQHNTLPAHINIGKLEEGAEMN
jgi:hypothetical protein